MHSNEIPISHETTTPVNKEKETTEEPKTEEKKDNFECNICFDSAEEPVGK
jgi:hypothetical protein